MLRSLHPDGRRLVVPELASGERQRWEEHAYVSLVRATTAIDLEAFDAAVDDTMHGGVPHDASLDARLALSMAIRKRRNLSAPG